MISSPSAVGNIAQEYRTADFREDSTGCEAFCSILTSCGARLLQSADVSGCPRLCGEKGSRQSGALVAELAAVAMILDASKTMHRTVRAWCGAEHCSG